MAAINSLENGGDFTANWAEHVDEGLVRRSLIQLHLGQDGRVTVALERLHAHQLHLLLVEEHWVLWLVDIWGVLDHEEGNLADTLLFLLFRSSSRLLVRLGTSLALSRHFTDAIAVFLIALDQALQLDLTLHELLDLAKLGLHVADLAGTDRV